MRAQATTKSQIVEISYGGQRIPIALSLRTGDRLSISVHPDRRVTALAPAGRSLEEIASRLRARAGWITRQLQSFERFVPAPVPRRFVSGETHVYLGRQYRLRVRQSEQERVCFDGGYIHVETRSPRNIQRVREQLSAWYRKRADEVLRSRVEICCERMRIAPLSAKVLGLRKMSRRWGSCTRSSRVLLNPDLIRVSVQCIDYVIVHEICHLRVLRHDKRFYSLLATYLPDWRRRKARLDAIALPLQ
jgi:predicted metal-dependent hydrolase